MSADRVDHALEEIGRRSDDFVPELSSELERSLGQIGPVRGSKPGRSAAVVLVGACIVGLLATAIVGPRADMHQLPITWLVGVGVGWLLLCGVLFFTALRRSSPTLSASPVASRWAVLGAAVIAIGGGALSARQGSASVVSNHGLGDFLRNAGPCLIFSVMVAAVPMALAVVALRRTAATGERWIAAAVGAGSGALGGAVLHLHCNVADGAHVGLVHGGALALLAGLCALALARIIRT